ncbi:alpha/beta hydrolase [Maioricimonas rarisocia]|nr:alpha/beta hydrolase [Maioricimonas rarisocia]
MYPASRAARLQAAQTGLPSHVVQDVVATADDGLHLRGLLYGTERCTEEAAPLVIFFPGNGGHRLHRLPTAMGLLSLGCAVLHFDYRGYGDNPGVTSEPSLHADALAVWKYATQHLEIPAERIVLFGESLGGAVATRLAVRAGTPPAAVVLNGTFASMVETAAWHYPYLPIRWVLRDRWPSIDYVPQVTSSLLQFHGTADDIVPLDHGRALFEAAPTHCRRGQPKSFVPLDGYGHNNITLATMRPELSRFLMRIGLAGDRLQEASDGQQLRSGCVSDL